MGAVARPIHMRLSAASVAATSSLFRAQIASRCAHLRRMPFGVLVTATAALIVSVALVILAQTTPSSHRRHAITDALDPY
jgi:hypothetical protein